MTGAFGKLGQRDRRLKKLKGLDSTLVLTQISETVMNSSTLPSRTNG